MCTWVTPLKLLTILNQRMRVGWSKYRSEPQDEGHALGMSVFLPFGQAPSNNYRNSLIEMGILGLSMIKFKLLVAPV